MPPRTAIVPVAGLGTRLRPLTRAVPKELLPLGPRPVVQRVVEELAACGIERVVLVSAVGKTAIEDHLDAVPAGVAVAAVRQPEPLGLGDAVLRAAVVAAGEEPVAVALGDAVLGRERPSRIVATLLAQVEERGADGAIALEAVALADTVRYGIAVPRDPAAGADDVLALAGLVEKPAPAAAPSRLAVAGRYVLPPAIFGALERTPPGARGELELTDAIALLIREGAAFAGVRLPAAEPRYDVGSLEGYCAAFLDLALTDPDLGPALRARTRDLLDELDGERAR